MKDQLVRSKLTWCKYSCGVWHCCQSDPDEIKSGTEGTFAQYPLSSLWNRCFSWTALNSFCLVLSPCEIPHLNTKSSTHFNIFSCKSLGNKFCVIIVTDMKQSQNHLDWERPLGSSCPTVNEHHTGWPVDFKTNLSMKHISTVLSSQILQKHCSTFQFAWQLIPLGFC